jgi:Myosin head (motor domain)
MQIGDKEIKVAIPLVSTKASEEDADVPTPGATGPVPGPDGTEELIVSVSAEKERQLGSGASASSTSDYANVKLRNSALDEVVASTSDDGGSAIRGGVDDLTLLTHLHEPAILDVLHSRYRKNTIYTFTGPILLAVNPFQKLPHLYSKEVLEEHYTRGLAKAAGVQQSGLRPLAPHVFSLADNAYRSMMAGELLSSGSSSSGTTALKNQSLLVSGLLPPLKEERRLFSFVFPIFSTALAILSFTSQIRRIWRWKNRDNQDSSELPRDSRKTEERQPF